jgi:regulator of nucleoside diphosphate kinase
VPPPAAPFDPFAARRPAIRVIPDAGAASPIESQETDMSSHEPICMTDLDQLRLRTVLRTLLARPGGDRDCGEELRDLLDSARVVPANAIGADVVTMNSTIVCRGEPLGEADKALTLVYPDRADSAAGCISILSPLGRALIGARAGSAVDVEAPGGSVRRVSIRGIRYQPEAAGDWAL